MSKAVEVVLKILLSIYGNQMHGIIRQTTVIMIVVSAIKSKKIDFKFYFRIIGSLHVRRPAIYNQTDFHSLYNPGLVLL